ncbi:uncharacterized protein CLUP02_16650 [Colletotrichum lupini]|uniref:ZZ-type domain-containing protein n=1 Tax=Colletotrichum lupini TaxID=145971 RepID=A0A9Q8WPV7_9PEZI|nr:uncharacterized protein CLUP02_16650 [Colletotrichum lupini]UQC91116.1 hypothetical protein CLUP02_16650 [Colletotrichum lupini]
MSPLIFYSDFETAWSNTGTKRERFGENQADKQWAAFVDLINRPWFSRRWTVQEAVLSNQKYAHLGSRTFCLGYLVWLCGFGSLQLKFYHLHKEPLEYSECRRCIYERRQTISHFGKAIRQLSGLESFDARDGVYAFLSMASDIDTEEWFPDYSDQATTMQIFAKAALHIIQQTGSLDIICRRIHDRSFSLSVSHPSSWIPWYGLQTIDFMPEHSHWLSSKALPDRQYCSTRWREMIFCDGCHSKIQGTGYACVDCEKVDFCYKCIGTGGIVAPHHSPTHRFKAHNNAVYFASGHFAALAQRYSSQENLRNACSKSKNHLQLVVRGFFVDTITNIGLGGVVQRHVDGFRVESPWENWIPLLRLDEIDGLGNERNLNAAFLRALFVKILHANFSDGQWACDMEHTTQLLSSMEVMVSMIEDWQLQRSIWVSCPRKLAKEIA